MALALRALFVSTALAALLAPFGIAQRGEPGYLGLGVRGDRPEPTVSSIEPDSPADRAGIEPGDVIVAVDGKEIATVRELAGLFQAGKAGDRFRFRIRRGRDLLEVEGTLATPPILGPGGRTAIIGQPAPAWRIERWARLPEGADPPTPDSLAGKVVVILCFQSRCPGCHSRGFPVSRELEKRYADDERVVFLQFQTAFEGLSSNTFDAGLETLEKMGIEAAYGHAPGSADHRPPALMTDYLVRGTPWSIVIGPDGKVDFSNVTLKADTMAKVIERALAEIEADGGEER